MTENGHRRDMHPAEQIAGFRAMAQEGKTLHKSVIAGYSPRQSANAETGDLAPVILMRWQKTASPRHCQALALENDTARQVQVFEAPAVGWGGKPESIACTESEVAVAGNINSASWGLMPSRQTNCAPICSATTRVAMWTAWRSMPPCWKNSRLSQSSFGKPKAGNGAPDAWSLSVSAVRMPEHTAVCRSRKRC
ncbi:putative ydeB protein [Escherichia coli BCE011_MS-01]|nr:putative ydeB protein [Escherichia coli BCE011_MS-01]